MHVAVIVHNKSVTSYYYCHSFFVQANIVIENVIISMVWHLSVGDPAYICGVFHRVM